MSRTALKPIQINRETCSIDEVIEQLGRIIEWAEKQNNPLGFFPALYRAVTIRVANGIKVQRFADGGGMELSLIHIYRFVLKNNRGQLKLSAFDMLQRNLGFSRNSNFNYIEEISTATLSRYFLLSFTYSLSRVGLKSEGQGGFIMN